MYEGCELDAGIGTRINEGLVPVPLSSVTTSVWAGTEWSPTEIHYQKMSSSMAPSLIPSSEILLSSHTKWVWRLTSILSHVNYCSIYRRMCPLIHLSLLLGLTLAQYPLQKTQANHPFRLSEESRDGSKHLLQSKFNGKVVLLSNIQNTATCLPPCPGSIFTLWCYIPALQTPFFCPSPLS